MATAKSRSPIKMNYNYLLKRLRQGRFLQTLFNLKVEGQPDVHVICRGVQRDVVKDLPTHVDFMRIHDESRIKLFIHVTFDQPREIARPEARRHADHRASRSRTGSDGGRHPRSHHGRILTGKKIGDVIHINDVELPNGVKADDRPQLRDRQHRPPLRAWLPSAKTKQAA
jgi:large subunit ribosomal protein L25